MLAGWLLAQRSYSPEQVEFGGEWIQTFGDFFGCVKLHAARYLLRYRLVTKERH